MASFRHFCHFLTSRGKPRIVTFVTFAQNPGPERHLREEAGQSGPERAQRRQVNTLAWRPPAGHPFHCWSPPWAPGRLNRERRPEGGVKDDNFARFIVTFGPLLSLSGKKDGIPGCLAAGCANWRKRHFCHHNRSFRVFPSLLPALRWFHGVSDPFWTRGDTRFTVGLSSRGSEAGPNTTIFSRVLAIPAESDKVGDSWRFRQECHFLHFLARTSRTPA